MAKMLILPKPELAAQKINILKITLIKTINSDAKRKLNFNSTKFKAKKAKIIYALIA